jgi:phospholipid/cholesterol/gamma-HCH transport system permease protein
MLVPKALMDIAPSIRSTLAADRLDVAAAGSWTIDHATDLEDLVAAVPPPSGKRGLVINAHGLGALDTLGAWMLDRVLRGYRAAGAEARIVGLPAAHRRLFGYVEQSHPEAPARPASRWTPAGAMAALGQGIGEAGSSLLAIVAMLGSLSNALANVVTRPRTFRITALVHHIDRVCWQAIPIILLISFLIGGIIAQQGIFQLRTFGASDYAVDLLGILVLREIGVLIVAIMVAGRSGSSYTAEIGAMKMREEVDALRVMGLDPVEVLMLPRVLAIVVALPILTLFGMLSALVGGGLVSCFYGGIDPAILLERLRGAISTTHFEVGIVKAPFMALIVGTVACAEGLRVQGSVESLGLQTTSSVVKAIFFVIVVDGLFAIFFASIGM